MNCSNTKDIAIFKDCENLLSLKVFSNTVMPSSASKLLKEIRDLMKSVDRKLDKLLNRKVLEEKGLDYDQNELLKSLTNSMRFRSSHALSQIESPSQLAALRSIGIESRTVVPRKNFVPGTFASLPEHLRRTMQAIVTLGEATAFQVSKKTGRSRAAESDYLNQLVDRGFLKKVRKGREIVFQVFSLHTLCPMCGSRVPLNAKFCSYCGAALHRPEQSSAFISENQK